MAKARDAGDASPDWYFEWVLALDAAGRADEADQAWQQARELGMSLGPRIWAALGRREGACTRR